MRVVIIGGGVVGCILSYFAACRGVGDVILVEQEGGVAMHASGRNTGKVHAPYLYDPAKKRMFSRATLAGFDMWKGYAKSRALPFREDGVMEVASDEAGVKTLEKYKGWGLQNGLKESDMELMDGSGAAKMEPALKCHGALFCSRDASVDYAGMVRAVKIDAESAGVKFRLGKTVTAVTDSRVECGGEKIDADVVVNAAGGGAMDIAHMMGVALGHTYVHFRGEYWRAPPEYGALTTTSIYPVPKFSEYPFLDPHWVVRVDGACDVGPNAVPVFSPRGYDIAENIRRFPSKMAEMAGSGARKAVADPRFRSMVIREIASSVSKNVMIGRVAEFLPALDPKRFTQRGAAGIRSSAINKDGRFESDIIIKKTDRTVHVLNYNSPGASGAPAFCAYLLDMMRDEGYVSYKSDTGMCGPWNVQEAARAIK